MPYKNPPKSTRFHIGKSGNPFGRIARNYQQKPVSQLAYSTYAG